MVLPSSGAYAWSEDRAKPGDRRAVPCGRRKDCQHHLGIVGAIVANFNGDKKRTIGEERLLDYLQVKELALFASHLDHARIAVSNNTAVIEMATMRRLRTFYYRLPSPKKWAFVTLKPSGLSRYERCLPGGSRSNTSCPTGVFSHGNLSRRTVDTGSSVI